MLNIFKNQKINRKIIFIWLIIFIFLGLVIRTIKLTNQPFYDWDEGIYAQVSKEIIENKTIKTTFNGEIWLNKPPLLHLITAAALKVFNYSETAARLIITFFSFIVILLTYKLTLKTIKNKQLAILAVLLLVSSKTYIERSSILNTDIIIGLSWIGYVYFIDKFWIKTLFLVFGVWSKSLVGFFPLVFEIIYFFHKNKNITLKKLLNFALRLLLQVFLASLWYIYAYLNFGDYFLKAHFYDQIFKRVIKPIESHFGNNLGILYYPYLLWTDSKILTILFTAGFTTIFYKLARNILNNKDLKRTFYQLKSIELLSLFFVPFLALLIISKSKIYWYIVFILPFLSIIAVYLLAQIKNKLIYKLSSVFVFILAISLFIKQTYLYQHRLQTNERSFLAKCVKQEPEKKIAYLMKTSDRANYRFLRENDLDTETTFIYGGSPSFVYYSDKNPTFFYDEQEFIEKFKNYPIVIIQKLDYINLGIDANDYDLKCESQDKLDHKKWLVFTKR